MPPSPFPLLFFNLGGEMLYVLNQRLEAQNVPSDKSQKVLSDIISTMFKPNFCQQLFESKSVYGMKTLCELYKKLIHASVMRVSKDSMGKLFDLMVMAVKYQTVSCQNPSLLLHVCLNHMDEIIRFVKKDKEVLPLVVNVFHKLVETYSGCTMGAMFVIRQQLLAFLQGHNVKITMYLASKVQNPNGFFVAPTTGPVPVGFKIPGQISIYKSNKTKVSSFETGCKFKTCDFVPGSSYDVHGVRATKIGENVYSVPQINRPSSIKVQKPIPVAEKEESSKMAAAELDMLSQMLGLEVGCGDYEFKLNLFSNDEMQQPSSQDVQSTSKDKGDEPISIETRKNNKEHLKKIIKDLEGSDSEHAESGGNDILDLLDSLN